MRFSLTDVREIISIEHRANTRHAIGHEPCDEELIEHWLKFHVQREIIHFNVEPQVEWGCKKPVTHLEPYPLPQTAPGEDWEM